MSTKKRVLRTEEVLDFVANCNISYGDFGVTALAVADFLGVSPSTALRHLKLLAEQDWVRKSGSRPTFWNVTPRGATAWHQQERFL